MFIFFSFCFCISPFNCSIFFCELSFLFPSNLNSFKHSVTFFSKIWFFSFIWLDSNFNSLFWTSYFLFVLFKFSFSVFNCLISKFNSLFLSNALFSSLHFLWDSFNSLDKYIFVVVKFLFSFFEFSTCLSKSLNFLVVSSSSANISNFVFLK